MKFGAHEVMEASEILAEKMNIINHFALYEQEAQDEQLRSLIRRHMDTAIQAYDQVVAYTHDYSARHGMQTPFPQPNATIESLKYGLRNPQPVAPQRTGRFNDQMIQAALLTCHKASAISHMQRGLEVTDPHLRQMFVNGAITCFNQAYEVFLMMNQQGGYQVPSMDDHTAKTLLHSFQPMNAQQAGMMQAGMNASSTAMGHMQGQSMQGGQMHAGMQGNANAMHMPQTNAHYYNQ
ncbi:spore coat protein [Paenibacillus sp. TRM 82003]|nr:spore coat protein [Paenibacillus sp. TRM 82003]